MNWNEESERIKRMIFVLRMHSLIGWQRDAILLVAVSQYTKSSPHTRCICSVNEQTHSHRFFSHFPRNRPSHLVRNRKILLHHSHVSFFTSTRLAANLLCRYSSVNGLYCLFATDRIGKPFQPTWNNKFEFQQRRVWMCVCCVCGRPMWSAQNRMHFVLQKN